MHISADEMDEVDKKILNRIQKDFPICSHPYQAIGEELGLTEEEVFCKVKKLHKQGVIRRIGASFDSHKMGFFSTLVAMKVSKEKLEQVVRIVNSFPEVTHNYLRDNEFNLWFTLIANSENRINEIVREIQCRTEVEETLSLPAKNLFKIAVQFKPDFP